MTSKKSDFFNKQSTISHNLHSSTLPISSSRASGGATNSEFWLVWKHFFSSVAVEVAVVTVSEKLVFNLTHSQYLFPVVKDHWRLFSLLALL